jgi:hypothetical protein
MLDYHHDPVPLALSRYLVAAEDIVQNVAKPKVRRALGMTLRLVGSNSRRFSPTSADRVS